MFYKIFHSACHRSWKCNTGLNPLRTLSVLKNDWWTGVHENELLPCGRKREEHAENV
jgi:hypothetical protein